MRSDLVSRVDCIVQADVDPATCYATQRHLLESVGQGLRPPALHVYSFPTDHASLGRFHIAPADRGTELHRRFAGGRVLPIGPGYAGLALVLPQRDALTDGAPGSLSASQAMNRHVRGFLKACRAAGIDPIYPGRDVVTVGKRIMASLALETDRRGAALFEMLIAVWRAFDDAPSLIDRADPDGVVTAAVMTSGEVTDLEQELERRLGFDELVALLRHGFSEQLRAPVTVAELGAAELATVRALAADAAASEWVYGRCRSARLTHRGSQLGVAAGLDVYFEERDGVLGEVVVSGDFIANSDSVLRLENAMRGCRREAAAIDAAMATACPRAGDFLLGIGGRGAGGPLAVIRDAILRGEPW
jgi:lipoate-protein ligase A